MNLTISLKRPKDKESVLITRFTYSGVNFKFYSGKTIQTVNWSQKRQLVLSGEENYDLINEFLDKWKGAIKRAIVQIQLREQIVDKDAIQIELDRIFNPEKTETHDSKVKDFISFIDAYILPRKNRKREVQKLEQTKKLLLIGFDLISKTRLEKWERLSIKEKSQNILKADKKLAFYEITLKFIERFRDFLYQYTYTPESGIDKNVPRHYKVNYIDKLVKGLKQIINAAIEEGYVVPFRWTSIKSEERQVDSVYTDFDEIRLLNDVPLKNETDRLVRDKYVLNCFLGLRYSDLNKLEPHLFKPKTIAGKDYMIYSARAQKTDHKVEFALHPFAISILEKYNYNLPKIASTEFNQRIKIVARLAGLTELERIREIRGRETITRDIPKCELLSSHAGRRSFCTNFYNEGVSIGAIMSISGHSTEKEFRKYIKKPSVRVEVVAEQISGIMSQEKFKKSLPIRQNSAASVNETEQDNNDSTKLIL